MIGRLDVRKIEIKQTIKPVTMWMNFLLYIKEKLKYFTPISTDIKKIEMIVIETIEMYQSDNDTESKIFKIGLTKQQY